MKMKNRVVTLALLLCTLPLWAEEPLSPPPTPEEFLSYKIGEQFTPHHRLVAYLEKLAQTSPLVTLERYGETYEGRPLYTLVITSARNHAALESIRSRSLQISRPDRTSEVAAAQIASETPAVVWLAFGVHGDESSSAEAAITVARQLLDDSEQTQRILEECVVIIDPLQNPDGRERYVQWFARTRGAKPNPNPDAFEHTQPWPGGRFNHYLTDMNRDWSWVSQRETRGRVDAYRRWEPQVYVDFHEMGPELSYFFPPGAEPVNANVAAGISKWLELFGRANAEAFTRNGWSFFVKDIFDLFYPGYGDSWPSLRGAVGMTYEVAGGGRGGSLYQREDGSVLSLGDRVARHVTTAMATLRTAAAHRRDLILYTHQALARNLAQEATTFLLPPGSPNLEHVAEILTAQGIEVGLLRSPVTVKVTPIDSEQSESRPFPAGTVVVSTRQPLGSLARALLERTPVMSRTFLDQQRDRADGDESDQFYDVTSWSLPIATNVAAFVTRSADRIAADPWVRGSRPAVVDAARYGYLVNGTDPNVYRAAGALLAAKMKFSVATEAFRLGTTDFARGTLLIVRQNNSAQLESDLQRIAEGSGATLIGADSPWIGETSFGALRFQFVREPKIALVGGPGIGATGFGSLWFTLDRDTPIPHSVVTSDRLGSIDMSRFNVIVLPDSEELANILPKSAVEKLSAWVKNGGTLVAVKGAAAFLRSKDVELSKLKEWEPAKKKEGEEEVLIEERYNDFRIPGAALRTKMNERSYLTFGLSRPPAVTIDGSKTLLPLPHKVDNVVTVDATSPLIAGFAFPESIERVKGSVYLAQEKAGKGAVITFADDPHFRVFWRGTLPMFLNAVLYAPSFR